MLTIQENQEQETKETKRILVKSDFSIVFTRKVKNKTIVIKQSTEISQLENEFKLLSMLNHINIIKCISYNEPELSLEYCKGGDLLTALMTQDIELNFKKKMFLEVANAINDVKLENILLVCNIDEYTSGPIVKLCDFGLSERVVGISTPKKAPELLLQPIPDLKKCDIWSLGVVLYALLFKNLPFTLNNGTRKMFSKICLGEYIIPECDEETRMIVTGLLQVKPEKRISLETIFSMHWVQTGDETVDEEEDDVLDRNGPFVA